MPKMLPAKGIGYYAKTAVAVALGGLYALQAALSDGTITNTEWVAIGLAALTAAGVFVTPNVAKMSRKHDNVTTDPNLGIKAGLGYPPVTISGAHLVGESGPELIGAGRGGGVLPTGATKVKLEPGEHILTRDVISSTFAAYAAPFTRTRGQYGRQPKKTDPRTLQFGRYYYPNPSVGAALPDHIDWYSKVTQPWGMLLNDQLGDCTIAAKCHLFMAQAASSSGSLLNFTDHQALVAYEGLGYNPGNPSSDQGATMIDALNYTRKTGIGGHQVGAYAEINPANHDHVKAALILFGAVDIGLNLPRSAETQFDQGKPWDVVKGSPIVGGHDVCLVGYNPTGPVAVTWGQTQQMTWAFLNAFCDEAYAVLDPDWFTAGKAPSGFDLAALTADLASIKGDGPVPLVVPPVVPPVTPPVDPPSPVATPDDQRLWTAVKPWVMAGHGSTTRPVAAALKSWATSIGLE